MIRNAFKICSLFLALILCFSGCYEARQSNESSGVWEGQASIEAFETEIAQPDTNVTATSGGNVDSADTTITLKESTAEIVGSGAKLDGNDIVITKGGTYAVSGKLSNGRIIVSPSLLCPLPSLQTAPIKAKWVAITAVWGVRAASDGKWI